MRYHKKVKMAL